MPKWGLKFGFKHNFCFSLNYALHKISAFHKAVWLHVTCANIEKNQLTMKLLVKVKVCATRNFLLTKYCFLFFILKNIIIFEKKMKKV